MNPTSFTTVRLHQLISIASEAGALHIAEKAQSLENRLSTGLFYVACIGQYKRGKSTLINALVGYPILPHGVLPVTSVVTILKYGEELVGRVRYLDGREEEISPHALSEYVSEEKNPENSKGVGVVEVYIRSPLLSNGMCLVDTPGIGSVFSGNTEVTKAFVPHIDAAIFVLGADPPISAEELELASNVAKQCPVVLFALNKADKMERRDIEEAIKFTSKVLSDRLGLSHVIVYEVSALEQLKGRGFTRDWEDLVSALETISNESKAVLLQSAEARWVSSLSKSLLFHIEEAKNALLRPIEESQERIDNLRTIVKEAQRSLNDLDYIFMGEQERICKQVANMKNGFLRDVQAKANQEFVNRLRSINGDKSRLREQAINLAHDISTRWVERLRKDMEPVAERIYKEAANRFVEIAKDFLERLSKVQGCLVVDISETTPFETGFRVRSRLYYASLMYYTTQSPLGWLLDRLRPKRWLLEVVEQEIGEYLHTLIFSNASRIESDIFDRISESRRKFLTEIRASIEDGVRTAENALRMAYDKKSQGEEAVHKEILRLNALEERLRSLDMLGVNHEN